MNQPDGESGVQVNRPSKPCTGFTTDRPPAVIARVAPRFRWIVVGPILFAVVTAAALIAEATTGVLEYAITGYPTTPMTVAKAERMANGGPPGSSVGQVKAWLISQGITSTPSLRSPYFDELRRDGKTSSRDWMGCQIGDLTPADRAGVKGDDVYSVVSVDYPDAERRLLIWDEITIYFFFDADGRLIKHWVDVDHSGL